MNGRGETRSLLSRGGTRRCAPCLVRRKACTSRILLPPLPMKAGRSLVEISTTRRNKVGVGADSAILSAATGTVPALASLFLLPGHEQQQMRLIHRYLIGSERTRTREHGVDFGRGHDWCHHGVNCAAYRITEPRQPLRKDGFPLSPSSQPRRKNRPDG